MADGDGGVRLQEQQRHRLADRVAAADHHRVLAAQVDAGASRSASCSRTACTGGSPAGPVISSPALSDREAVDVLAGEIASITLCGSMCARQRHLHEDAVDGRIGVQRVDALEQRRPRRGRRRIFRATEWRPASAQALTLLRT